MKIDSILRLSLDDITPEKRRELMRALTYPNPKFEDAKRLGFSVRFILPTIQNFKINLATNELTTSRGEIRKVRAILPDEKIEELEMPKSLHKIVYDNRDFALDPRQERAVEAIARKKQGIIHAATSAGKSAIILRAVAALNTPAIVVVHRKVLLAQLLTDARKWLKGCTIGQIGDGKCDIGCDVTFAIDKSLASYLKRLPYTAGSGWGVLIQDECFPAGTKVETQAGAVDIERISVGDVVMTASGWGRIKRKSKRQTSRLLRLRFSNGESVTCTPNHPIITSTGVYEARHILPGDLCYWLYAVHESPEEDVQGVPRDIQDEPSEANSLLPSVLLEPSFDCAEDEELHVQPRDEEKTVGDAETYGASSSRTRREREAAAHTCQDSFGCFGLRSGLGCGACRKDQWDKDVKNSAFLQDRYCFNGQEDSDRSGWQESLHIRTKVAGQEKRYCFAPIRVESVETEERGCDVFNLEVFGDHTFFADGLLVHNCHLAPASTFQNIVSKIDAPRRYGFTGTLKRKDRMEFLIHATYGEVIATITKDELLEADRVSPVEVNIVESETEVPAEYFDLPTTKRWQAIDKSLHENEKRKGLTTIIADQIWDNNQNAKIVILSRYVDPCYRIGELLETMSYKVGYVTGQEQEAAETCKKFERGEVQIMCATIGCFSTGVNIPNLTDIILISPIFNNELLLKQIYGRLMRKSVGKTHGTLHFIFDQYVFSQRQLKRAFYLMNKP